MPVYPFSHKEKIKMKYVLGIDVGSTTTKIVAFQGEKLIGMERVRASDPQASLYGAFGKFTNEHGIAIGDIERIMLTGAGASFIQDRIFGLPTGLATEFSATGLGGLYLSGREKGVVCSVGTGTAFVMADREQAVHLGGTGVGGGTLHGLAGKLIGVTKVQTITDLAKEGDLGNIDLRIGDISHQNIGSTLDLTMTAANFGNISDMATKSDFALGIINLVLETIAMMAVFCVRDLEDKSVVLTGGLVTNEMIRDAFLYMGEVLDVDFIIPENAGFATAVGASLVYRRGWDYAEL